MIIKVKEPLKKEYSLIKEGQIIYTFFHFASSKELTQAMIDSNSICIAYETVENSDGSLPLLTPMSEVAGRMAAQQGAKFLEKHQNGCGILLGGIPGVSPAKAVVIGAVLLPGAKAPNLITKEMLKDLEKGTVLVDVAVDQGGCFETTKPTTHSDPTYIIDDVLHYSVANMPGAVPMTSTEGLTNATINYAIEIANKGWKQACIENIPLKKGLNIVRGDVVYQAVAEAFNMKYTKLNF